MVEQPASPSQDQGQSLVEYALVLVLVAVVVLLILAVFGERIQKTYCGVVYSLDPNANAPFCEALDVSCNVQSSSPFRMEAVVVDSAGEDNIQRVQFYVDGILHNTEFQYHYCLQGGDASPCNPYPGSPGEHTFSAVAFDLDGNVGQCEITHTIP